MQDLKASNLQDLAGELFGKRDKHWLSESNSLSLNPAYFDRTSYDQTLNKITLQMHLQIAYNCINTQTNSLSTDAASTPLGVSSIKSVTPVVHWFFLGGVCRIYFVNCEIVKEMASNALS